MPFPGGTPVALPNGPSGAPPGRLRLPSPPAPTPAVRSPPPRRPAAPRPGRRARSARTTRSPVEPRVGPGRDTGGLRDRLPRVRTALFHHGQQLLVSACHVGVSADLHALGPRTAQQPQGPSACPVWAPGPASTRRRSDSLSREGVTRATASRKAAGSGPGAERPGARTPGPEAARAWPSPRPRIREPLWCRRGPARYTGVPGRLTGGPDRLPVPGGDGVPRSVAGAERGVR